MHLDAYLPIDRRLALLRGEPLPDRAFGAALFADISGFTPLSAALAQELGPRRGAEVLTTHLDRVHGALIEQVHRYHGSIVDFSGDAITCWFDETSAATGEYLDSHRLAATCALAMQQTIADIEAITTASGAVIPLTVKVGLTAGPARRFVVGDPQIQCIDTLAGAILDRLASADENARQGEVLADEAITGRLGRYAVLAGQRHTPEGDFSILAGLQPPASDAPWPHLPELANEEIRSWILAPIFHRLQRGQEEYMAELRTAVALFVRFTGLNYDADDDAGAKLDGYIRWCQSVLARYEGHLLDLTIGDKGSYFYATFGAIEAHEDDARRAVTAALTLSRLPAHLDFINTIQIGMSLGSMRTGAYGSHRRRTYGANGRQVNVAARLMSYAPSGAIVACDAVARDAAGAAHFHDLGPLTLKGLEVPVYAYQVLPVPEGVDGHGYLADGASARTYPAAGVEPLVAYPPVARQAAPIVGRVEERARLAEMLQALQEGRSGNVIIEGEAGIGKSRLMDDFLDQARRLSLPARLGAGSAMEQTTPYHAWRPIFRALLQSDAPADDLAALRRSVEARLSDDPHFAQRAPLLNDVLPLALPDNELTAGMTGKVRADNTVSLLVHLLRQDKSADSPLILVVEDAHWLDSASWVLVDRVRRDLDTLLIMIVTRPLPERADGENGQISRPAAYEALLAVPNTLHLRLNRLPDEEALALVRQRLGVDELPEPVNQLILERAEGHPFFSEEIAFALRDAGFIRVSNRRATLDGAANLDEINFPNTVQGVITSRIDRLQPGEELALKVASVIGRVFQYRTLADVHPVASDRPHLGDYLATLDRLDITPLESREPELTYIFRHAIIREVAYGLLLFTQRRQLHEAVAGWYEKAYASDLAAVYPLLATHWERAQVPEKSIYYLGKAGEQALRTYANREAVTFLTRALALDKQAKESTGQPLVSRLQRVTWLRMLGEAYLGVGQLPESRATLMEMLSLARRAAPASKLGLIGNMGFQVFLQAAHRLLARQILGQARGEEAATVLEAARAYQQLAEIYYYANERMETVNAGLSVLNLTEHAGPSPELVRAYANMVVIAGLIPWHSAAETYTRWALETSEQVGDPSSLGWTRLLVGTYKTGLGRWQEVKSEIGQAIEIFQELGDLRQLGLSYGVLAIVYSRQGDFEQSRQLYVEWNQLATETSNIQHQAVSLFGQAESILPIGRTEDAADLAQQGLTLLIERAEPSFENRTTVIRGYGLLAVARQRLGLDDLALEAAGEATVVSRQLSDPTRVTLLDGLSCVAEVYLTLWQAASRVAPTEAFRSSARQAIRIVGGYGRVFAIGQPRAHLWHGLYYWLDGQPRRARSLWQRSLATAERLHMPFEKGLAHLELGRHAAGPDRDSHLAQAHEIFSALGAHYHLAVTQAKQAQQTNQPPGAPGNPISNH